MFRVEVVEVAATPIEEDPTELPALISIVPGEEIRALGASKLAVALTLLSGVEAAPGGDSDPAEAVPELRRIREFDPYRLVVDGGFWGGAFDPAVSTVSLEDVDGIEGLRGGAPVFFRPTSSVGVVEVVRKQPRAPGGGLEARAGRFGSRDLRASVALRGGAAFRSRLSSEVCRRGFSDPRTGSEGGRASWRARPKTRNGSLRLDVEASGLDQEPESPHPREGPALSPRVPVDSNHHPLDARLDPRRLSLAGGSRGGFRREAASVLLSLSCSREDSMFGFLVGRGSGSSREFRL